MNIYFGEWLGETHTYAVVRLRELQATIKLSGCWFITV